MGAETKIIPQKTSAPLPLGIFAGVVLGATALGAGALVFFFNPSTHGFYPVCVFHSLTGLNCPGCGATRALYALLHGKVRLAVKDNVLFVVLLAALAVWGARFAVRKVRNLPASFNLPAKFLWTLLAIALVFAVVRNLPGFEWLSP
jgi:ethanolamine transporter EutH